MSSNNTKGILAQSLKELTKEKRLKSITITDIVRKSNLNRHTFYYHFKDKQDLVNWIYKDEIIKEISKIDIEKHWSEGTLIILNGLKGNKDFYTNALKTEGQNNFEEYLFLETVKNFHNVIENFLGINEIHPKALEFISRFYSYSFTYMTIEWIMNGMKETPEELMKKFVLLTENSLSESTEKLSKKLSKKTMLH